MSILHELAEQSRRGKVAYQTFSPNLRFLPPSRDWAMPSFDLGTFTYHAPNDPPPFIYAMKSAIEERAFELNHLGFVLPFERCAFIIKDPYGYNCIEIYEMMGEVIKHNSFFRKENGNGQWFFEPVDYYYSNELDYEKYKYYFDKSEWMDVLHISELNEDKMWMQGVNNLLIILAMLSMGKGEAASGQMDFVDSVNRGRAKADLSPIPATVTIRLNPLQSSPTGRQNDPGGTRCPHERRAHIRRLKSGRIVKVRASKIHGGSDTPPTYRVTG